MAAIAPLVQRDPGFGLTAGLGKCEPMPCCHTHGELELNYLYAGSLRYFIGGRFLELPERRLVAFWAAIPHQVVASHPGTEFTVVHVPLSTLLRWSLGNAFMRRIISGEVIVDASSPVWDADLTRRWIEDLERRDSVSRRTCELEIEARLRRLAHRRRIPNAPRVERDERRQKVEAITAYLAEHYRDEISTADIAAAVRLHPNYAMALFRRECGISIGQYLVKLRLAHAQLLLLSTDQGVLDVAIESGFGSLPRFYAAFTRECEMPPGEYRRRGR